MLYDAQQTGVALTGDSSMKIIEPHRVISRVVTDYSQIREDVEKMIALLDEKRFEGKWRDAFAIHHSQVSNDPFDFFVVNQRLVKEKSFPSRVIINAEVVEADKSYEEYTREGCMSYPHSNTAKIYRYVLLKVRYQIPRFGRWLKEVEETIAGVKAQVFQHEIDHALGIYIYDPQMRHKRGDQKSEDPNS